MFSSRVIGRLVNSSRNGTYLAAKHHIRVSRSTGLLPLKALRLTQITTAWRSYTPSSRSYTTQTQNPDEAQPEAEAKSEPPSEEWISILENTTSAPWLFSVSPDPKQRLKLAYTLLFQIVLYLTRPAEAEQFIVAFSTAPASPESEIGRARAAVGVIIRAAVRQLESVPLNSPIRVEQADIYDLFGALQVLHDTYLFEDISPLETWSQFWARAQPVVLELGIKLDEKGFGLTEDDWGDTRSAEEKAEKTSEGKSE